MAFRGLQWLSGRVLDSRPRGRRFGPHRGHCVVSFSKSINPSLVQCTGSTQEDLSLFITYYFAFLVTGRLASGSEFKVYYSYWTKFFSDIISLLGCNSD